ncbi:hypothetical protein MKX07_006164, partial [Trichoderma sp. CBMAI-0711]
ATLAVNLEMVSHWPAPPAPPAASCNDQLSTLARFSSFQNITVSPHSSQFLKPNPLSHPSNIVKFHASDRFPLTARQRAQRSRPGSQAERSEVEDLPASQDQISRPTASTSGLSALQNPSGQPVVESMKSSDHVLESSQSKGEGESAADGTSIESSGPSIRPEQHLKTPEAKVPQTHHMSGGNIPSDTNNEGTQVNVPQPVPMVGMRAPPPMPLGPYPGYMHPGLAPQQQPYGPAIPPPYGRPFSRDETQHLAETSIDKDSKIGSEPPAACQSNGQNIESPSAVDSRPSEEETTQSSPQPQQDRHVPSITQVSSDSQSVSNSQQHHNEAQESAQQTRYSRKVQVSEQPSHKALAEPASWSQSKRWISSETKERKAFQKMMMNLQFMKADQSPFVPKSPAELTKFRISLAEAKRKKLAQEEKRAVEPGSWNIPPVTSLNDGSDVLSQLELADLSEFMKEFMLDIQEHES